LSRVCFVSRGIRGLAETTEVSNIQGRREAALGQDMKRYLIMTERPRSFALIRGSGGVPETEAA